MFGKKDCIEICFNLFQECLWTCCEMRRVSFDWKVATWKAQLEWSYVNNLVGGNENRVGFAPLALPPL